MNPNPFTATAKAISLSTTSTASAAVSLNGQGNTIRVFNEGPNVVFLAITTQLLAIATLPTTGAGTTTSCPCIVGDTTLTIPNDQVYFVSGINRATQTSVLTLQVGEGY